MSAVNGAWSLRCKKEKQVHCCIKFEEGMVYHVKDKFPGDDGTTQSGYWEVKDGHGGLVSISKQDREKYFEEI